MLYGAQYCLECLIQSFPKARLPLCQFALWSSCLFCLRSSQVDLREDPADPFSACPLKCSSDIFPSTRVLVKPQLCRRFLQTAPIVRPHSWILGLSLAWARSNLGSQLICVVGLSFLLRMILGRDSMRSLFSPSPLDILLLTSRPFFLHNFSYL